MTMYAVMVNNQILPRSLCDTWDGAASYLGDARHAAAPKARVRVVRLVVTDCKTRPEDES